jgi:GT2 family glycosyltransferase
MAILEAIIISNAKTPELRALTQQAIDSLLNSKRDVECIATVIESSQTEPFDNAKTIYPKTPFGYNHYLNIGIKQSKADYIAMCNNDLLFTPGWADNIVRAMELLKLGSASPLCPYFHGPKSIHPFNAQAPVFECNQMLPGHKVGRHVAGWCLVATKETLKAIGGLDEDFIFWYSDNSYAAQLERAGISHGLVCNSVVHHLHGGSNSMKKEPPNKQRLLMAGAELFKKKYATR